MTSHNAPARSFNRDAVPRRDRTIAARHLIDEVRRNPERVGQGRNTAGDVLDCVGDRVHMRSEAQLHLAGKHCLAAPALRNTDNEAMLETSDKAVADRLTAAMDGVCTNTALANACDVSIQAVQQWKKNGKISRTHLPTIARMINRDIGWLLTGVAAALSEQGAIYGAQMAAGSKGVLETAPPIGITMTTPVVGTTQGGPDKEWIEEGYPAGFGDEYIDLPSKDPHAYGLRVRGTSMYPRMREGEVVSVSPATEPMPGDEVVVRTVDGAVMVKELVYNRNGEVALDSVADGEPRIVLTHAEIELMHTVTGVHRASSIKKR